MKFVNPFRSRTDEVITCVLLVVFVAVLVGVDYSSEGDWFRDGKLRYLLLGASAFVFSWLREANPFAAAFAAWSLLRWGWDDYPAHGIMDCMAISACLALGLELHRRLSPSAVSKVIAYCALLEASYGCIQKLGWEPFLNPDLIRPEFIGKPIGTMGEHMMLGAFLAMGAIYFFSEGKRWQFALCAGMTLVVGSSTAIVALIAAGLYGIFRWNPKVAGGLSVFSAIAMLAGAIWLPFVEFFSFSGRLSVWPLAVKAWLVSPIIGNGPGSWNGLLPRWGADHTAIGQDWAQVHNDWLQLLAEQGAIGFLIVAVGVAWLMCRARKLPAHYGAWIVCLSVDALGNFNMHVATFGIIAGWLCIEVWNQTQGESYEGRDPNQDQGHR